MLTSPGPHMTPHAHQPWAPRDPSCSPALWYHHQAPRTAMNMHMRTYTGALLAALWYHHQAPRTADKDPQRRMHRPPRPRTAPVAGLHPT